MASKPSIGNSFCMLSLAAVQNARIADVGFGVGRLWETLTNLKKGILSDLHVDTKHRKSGNLSVLVGYGQRLFDIPGVIKKRPSDFKDEMNFTSPDSEGGGPVFEGSAFRYSSQVSQNHLLSDHIILQFIADSEFYTNRAIVEVWKSLSRLKDIQGTSPMHITGIYSGFQREDHRNWLGFHDGISNLRRNERQQVVPINAHYLKSQDKWTQNGTFLAFMRIAIDLQKWIELSVEKQQILVGRDKLTGCPLVGVDRNGKPIKDIRCPTRGTSEIIDKGNERFRDHPRYGLTSASRILQFSHIGDTNPTNRIPIGDKRSLRIYRQGFEFLIPSMNKPGFMTGLNFVSFQNTPERLLRTLTYHPNKSVNSENPSSLNQFLSVLLAGIFYVPAFTQYTPFPGAEIFFNNKELRSFSSMSSKY